ncbi:MAG: D-2-hydroxyacid dehydrogenase [Spirochaetaceae bacterium]|jgi:phosphoglycerate dehydrogenase-like enzyme|nr:D-2-hydroxyacid dehydrogenase [Spirochaetaceae bacterium]
MSNSSSKGILLVAESIHNIRMNTAAELIGDALRKAGANLEILVTRDKAEAEKVLDRIEIAFGDIPFELIPKMPNLRWLQLWSAGADILQAIPELKTLPFSMTTTSGIHGQQIAEHVFALILTRARKMERAFRNQGGHVWNRPKMGEMSTLKGKAMLILGYGVIGEKVARAALAFGMKVSGLRRRAGELTTDKLGVTVMPAAQLYEALGQADYVVNILPHTADTEYRLGKKEFDSFKPQAVYVNVGRGKTTCETALAEALRTGRLAAALLDVTETEPLPGDSPLWDMENVLITPHYAGFHEDYNGLAMDIALENLGRYLRGETLRNLVDKGAGY